MTDQIQVKQSLKIQIPHEASNLAQDAFKELKKRGAEIRPEELFSELFDGLSKEYFDEQVERLTPETYFLDLAKSNPELLSEIVATIKKSFKPKRTRKKREKQATEEHVNGAH
jgi:cell division protein YceG involved in septum cleavage